MPLYLLLCPFWSLLEEQLILVYWQIRVLHTYQHTLATITCHPIGQAVSCCCFMVSVSMPFYWDLVTKVQLQPNFEVLDYTKMSWVRRSLTIQMKMWPVTI
uniref:Uncharacterized protein n=1 Tax=Rhipicephalus zambeziensis TaxID=60191 RepID=A0A224YG45_9ACAR